MTTEITTSPVVSTLTADAAGAPVTAAQTPAPAAPAAKVAVVKPLKLGVHALLTTSVSKLAEDGSTEFEFLPGHKVFITALSPLTVCDREGRSVELPSPDAIKTQKGRPVKLPFQTAEQKAASVAAKAPKAAPTVRVKASVAGLTAPAPQAPPAAVVIVSAPESAPEAPAEASFVAEVASIEETVSEAVMASEEVSTESLEDQLDPRNIPVID